MKSVRPHIKKKKKIPTVFHLPDIVKWHQEKQTIYWAPEWYLEAPELGILDQEGNDLGPMLLFCWQKRTCWFSRRKKIRPLNRITMLFGQSIITKHHFDELSIMNQEHAVSISLQIHKLVGLRGKCPIRHVLSCNALEDIESHWTQMDSGSTPPEWTSLPSTEVGFLHLTPLPL